MRNEIAEKIEIFLQNLRCEDTNRETLVHLEHYQKELKRLEELKNDYRQMVQKLEMSDRYILETYIDQMSSTAFAEQQEAYVQGIFDAFQILCGLGILSTNENVEKIIATLKNGSPQ